MLGTVCPFEGGHSIGSMRTLIHLKTWRFALRNLVAKDIRVRYRNMALGMLWSVINPLVMLGVIVFVFTYVFPRSRAPFFPVFVLIGLVLYNLMSRTVNTATLSVTNNASLVKKVAFPRILIPFSAVISEFVDGAVMLGLLGFFVLLFKVPITLSFLWMIPVVLIVLLFVIGLSMITSALNVFYRDTEYLVGSIFTIMFWLTPIFYPLQKIHESLPDWCYALYLFNPMAGCINTARRAILQSAAPDAVALGMAAAVAVTAFALGVTLFETMQRRFADYT